MIFLGIVLLEGAVGGAALGFAFKDGRKKRIIVLALAGALGCWVSRFVQVPFLELLRLLNTHVAVLLTPAIVSLLGDAGLSAGFSDRDTLVDVNLAFPQLVEESMDVY